MEPEQQPLTPPTEEVPAPQPPAGESSRPPHFWVMVVGAVVLVLAVAVAAFAMLSQRTATPTVATVSPSPTVSASATATASPTATPTNTVALVKDTGVVWLGTPVKVTTDLKLFQGLSITATPNPDPNNTYQSVGVYYYKVGTDNGKDIILADVPPIDPSGDHIGYFVATADGKYDLLQKHSPDLFSEAGVYNFTNALGSIVQVNTVKEYKSITVQKSLKINSATLTLTGRPQVGVFFKDPLGPTSPAPSYTQMKFADTAYGTLYLQEDSHTSGSASQIYVLSLQDGTQQQYQLKPGFIKDDMVPAITWMDGTKNTSTYRYDGGGSCGSPNNVYVISDTNLTDLAKAGTTSSGEAIYTFTNKNNAVVKEWYATLQNGEYYDSTKSTMVPITIDQYLAKQALFVYKDALGRLILFSSMVYGLQAECGKPVVYLYPTKTTQVSVKVAAKITVSDPPYNNGWNVTAQPNGTLTTADGKQYSSLFWEGFGKEYPQLSTGFVVTQADIAKTLQNHLAQLGLNKQESQDFLDFWLPKMPHTPYIRLTWFGTELMNKLAPLSITPQPDSVIRVFLDFAGLNQPQPIVAQRLSAIPRNGFTVVEWGGLLQR